MSKWNIYIDESFLKNVIITSFFGIPEKKENIIFEKYNELMYSNTKETEIKSSVVSDKRNKEALEVTRRSNSVYLISMQPLYEKVSPNLKLPNNLLAYISPIKKIFRQINYRDKDDKITIDIHIDESTELHTKEFILNANCLIKQFIAEIFKNQNCIFVIYFEDSKKNTGIQIADMLCGAYRKEIIYSKYGDDTKLIPLHYDLIIGVTDIYNQQFLGLIGLVQLNKDLQLVEKQEKTKNIKNIILEKLITLSQILQKKCATEATASMRNDATFLANNNKILFKKIVDSANYLSIPSIPKNAAKNTIKKAIEDFKQNCDNAIKSIKKMNIFDDTDMLENVEYVIQELN